MAGLGDASPPFLKKGSRTRVNEVSTPSVTAYPSLAKPKFPKSLNRDVGGNDRAKPGCEETKPSSAGRDTNEGSTVVQW
ncbi:hypothetical protein E4U55_005729 [Claviceps digitariae]|nr:hypothetical protein E4U55_005729 [Claviceps digitariae]